MDERTANDIVSACYRGILGREPDAAGCSGWVSFLMAQGSLAELLHRFAFSKEFQQKSLAGMTSAAAPLAGDAFYFYHIPKTAGMSVMKYLEHAAPGVVFPGFFIQDLLQARPVLDRYQYFSGHFLGFLDPFPGRKTRKATMPRDPLERTLSHYRHYTRDTSLPAYELMRGKTLAEVCRDRRLSGFIRNYHSRNFAALVSDPLLLRHTIEDREELPEDELFDAARRALREFEVLGVSEEFDRFIRTLAGSWRLACLPTEWRENVAPQSQALTLDPDVKQRILELTRVDREIYQLVMQSAAERSAGLPSGPA